MVEISIAVPVACGPYVSDFEITIAPVTPVSQTQSHVIYFSYVVVLVEHRVWYQRCTIK